MCTLASVRVREVVEGVGGAWVRGWVVGWLDWV